MNALCAACPPVVPSRPRTVRWARLHLILFAVTGASAALASLVASHVIVNCTPSLPLGLYWLSPGQAPLRGELVAFPVPASVRALVTERRYLPPGAMLVKHVIAAPGDRVCTSGGELAVNGTRYGVILHEDTAGRPLPHYDGCGPLPDGVLLMGSPYDKSFDSRTFGPVPEAAVRGTVRPIWTY